MLIPVKYALIYSAIVICIMLGITFSHAQLSGFGRFSGMVELFLMFPFILLAIKNRRDKDFEGSITLKEVMQTGMIVAALSIVIIGVFTYINYAFLQPDFLPGQMVAAISESEKFANEHRKTAQELTDQITATKEYYTPYHQAVKPILGDLLFGIFFSFICSTFLVRNPPAISPN